MGSWEQQASVTRKWKHWGLRATDRAWAKQKHDWPFWFISSLDACGAVSLGRGLMPVSVRHRVGVCPEGVRLLPFSVCDPRPCRFRVSHNPPVVDLVIVPFPISKPVITMSLHLQEIQGYTFRKAPPPLSVPHAHTSRTSEGDALKLLFCYKISYTANALGARSQKNPSDTPDRRGGRLAICFKVSKPKRCQKCSPECH